MNILFPIIVILVIGFTTWVSAPMFGYPLNGMSQADISNMYQTMITPAGFTFSIWSLIYWSWILVSVRGSFSRYQKSYIKKIIILYSTAMLLTAIWLVPWAYNFIGTSLVVMLVLLSVLKVLFHEVQKMDKIIKSSVSLFLWWIHIATIANITIWLVSVGFTGFWIPEIYWAIVVLALATGLTLWYQIKYQAYFISFVFLWAMLWIWFAHPEILLRFCVIFYGIVASVAIGYSCYKEIKNI